MQTMESSVSTFVNIHRQSAIAFTKEQRWKQFLDRKSVATNKNSAQALDYITQVTLKEYDLLQKKYTSQSILICPQCQSNNVTYVSKQIRRADESETYFCKCLACKKQWTFS